MLLTLIARARELFSDAEWRMYLASVVGRFGLRNPFGARRSMLLTANRATQLAKNDSKGRALLVNIQMFTVSPVRFGASQDIGVTELNVDPSNDPEIANGIIFVLAPGEQLFAQSAAAQSVAYGQEWF